MIGTCNAGGVDAKDVALSLQARQNALINPSPMMQAPQLKHLERALRLVQLYVECGIALQYLDERYCAVHYEDLPQNPSENLRHLSEFCELPRKSDFTGKFRFDAAEIESTGHDRRLVLPAHQTAQLWKDYPPALRLKYS